MFLSDSEPLQIELDGRYYPIKLRHIARAKSIAISADVIKKEVRISMPRHASQRQALSFALSKSDWLADQFAAAPHAVPIENGGEIAYAGEPHVIQWDPNLPRKPRRHDGIIALGGPEDQLALRLTRWLKAEARLTFQQDLDHYCGIAQHPAPRLSVGDARRRWGSCSSSGAMRLNWRLIMAPAFVRRSVVAHEVAHLRHMNHSAAFYAHLDSLFEGDRKMADRWLKAHGTGLHQVGAA